MVYISGQVGLDRDGNLAGDSLEEQTRAVFENIEVLLASANAHPPQLVNLRSFVVGPCDLTGYRRVRDNEFRSNLLPWLAMDQQRNPVTRVATRNGVLHSQDVAAAVTDDTVLVAVSEVLSSDGARQDLPLLRQACDATGARLLIDATQSLGVLRPFTAADYLIAHGYKRLLCPRGAGFLVAKPARYTELRPPLPSWKTGIQQSHFGWSYELAADAGRVNTSPAWLPWLAAEESLTLLRGLHQPDVERHCLRQARPGPHRPRSPRDVHRRSPCIAPSMGPGRNGQVDVLRPVPEDHQPGEPGSTTPAAPRFPPG